MPELNPIERSKIVRAAMEWIIDDYATTDIITKIVATWKTSEQEAQQILQDAKAEWNKNDDLQEQILSRRIESFKKMKRGMDEKEKKTPFGINVLINLENSLLRLEMQLNSIKFYKTSQESRKLKKEQLTEKQLAFSQEYVKSKNAKQSAITAGYSVRTATEQGSRLLHTPHVKAYIDDLLEEIRREAQVDAQMALNELKILADYNIQDFIVEGNQIVDLTTLPKAKTKPVVGIKSTEVITKDGEVRRTTELKLADKKGAWVDLNRHFGNFKEDNEQKVIKIKVTKK